MADERRKRLLDQILGHRAALQKYLRRFTAGAEDVEDLVQEAYVRICAMSPAQVESPRALLFSIARNLAVDRARQKLSHATDDVADFEPLNVSSQEAQPDEQVDLRRRFESFCDVVDSLPAALPASVRAAQGVSAVTRGDCAGARTFAQHHREARCQGAVALPGPAAGPRTARGVGSRRR